MMSKCQKDSRAEINQDVYEAWKKFWELALWFHLGRSPVHDHLFGYVQTASSTAIFRSLPAWTTRHSAGSPWTANSHREQISTCALNTPTFLVEAHHWWWQLIFRFKAWWQIPSGICGWTLTAMLECAGTHHVGNAVVFGHTSTGFSDHLPDFTPCKFVHFPKTTHSTH